MSQRGTPSAGEQFAGAQHFQANQQNVAHVVSQVAAEAARAVLQATQQNARGTVGHQQAQPASLQGAQAGGASLQGGQAGFGGQASGASPQGAQAGGASLQGAQAGFGGQASGQAGVGSQAQSSLLATQSPHLSDQQQAQSGVQQSDRFFPAVDVIETAEEVRVYADLPGVNSQSIQIEALDNTIMLSAERIDNDVESEEGRSVMRERGAVMERTLQIPKPVNIDGAEATWDQGVVTITLPKKDSENKREIGVQ